jgi:hypothetical protein
MQISKEIYSVLSDIVGAEYISDHPVICEGYRSGPGGYESGLGYERVMTKVPGCVIMPKTTQEVQQIVKVCYRHEIPYVPYSTGFYGPRSHPHVKGALLIDLKQMNDFILDEKHFYVEVGPGMVYSPIQEECMKHGAYVVIGGGGAQASAIANLIGDGWSPLSHRIGLPHRRILGTEVVMPDGEILRLGSLAQGGDDPFWGECPGPDLRGLLRGYTGLRGCLGIVTRMAIKTLPFQPERLLPTGISPNTALALPEKRVKWINFVVPSKEAQVKAMKEIGHAEIAGAVTKVPLFWRAIAKAGCKEEFWDLWGKENEQTVANFHIVRVLLIGYTSEEQMEYDERVLMDIMTEVGGVARRTKPSDEYGDPGWFQSFEMGHQGYSEFLVYWDQDDNTDPVDQFYVDTSKMNIKNRFYTSLLGPHQPLYLTGPKYGPNYHEFLLKVKDEFDPKWMSHPPVPLAHDVFVERAPCMHNMKDWESQRLSFPRSAWERPEC